MKGSTIGPYRVEEELGAGGMGTVYLARTIRPAAGLPAGAAVALKVLHPGLLQREGFFKRFLREAEIGRTVSHPNVVRTLDVDALEREGRQVHFLVMEFVEGRTLRALLAEAERLPEGLCRHVGLEVARGLAAIHGAGAVHRDLKPENILVSRDRHAVKVMDLGVARLGDEAVRLSQTGAFLGSVPYAAPEQFRGGGGDLDGRTDLHALGAVLYELASGVHPFAAEEPRAVMRRILEEEPRRLGEVNPQVSPFFEEVVHTLLAKDRDGRFPGAAELALVLERGEESEWWRSRALEIRAATRRPLRRIRIPRETALYGRSEEVRRLRALFARAKGGDGQVLLVLGEAGIGKTRLLDEFVGLLQREGEDVHFLFGSYPPGGAATASGAFSTAFREHFGEEGCAAHLARTPLLAPAFDALLKGEPPPEGQEPLDKDSLQTVFVHATRSLAAERTTIVLIEDLHFAPEEGLALFAALALAVPGHRVLLVGTARPGLPEGWVAGLERPGRAHRMDLARLGPKDLALLLADSFRSEQLATELGHRIAVKSDGNPFFVFEILRGLREGKFIARREDGTWVTTRVIEDLAIPSSVADLVNARVADLDEEERNILDVASCIGFEFDPLLVGAVLGIPQVPLMRRLALLEKRRRLVRSAGRRFVFDHHQVREALYEGMPVLLREPYHAAIAAALEERHGAASRDPAGLDGALCVDLAEHSLRGGEGGRALRYLDAALRHLESAFLNEAASRLADRALEAPGLLAGPARVEVLLRRAARLDLSGRREAERAALDEAVGLADALGDASLRARARAALGRHLANLSRHGEAEAALREAAGLARAAGDAPTEVRAAEVLGTVFLNLDRLADARGCCEGLLALSRRIGDRKGEGNAAALLGNVHLALGRVGEARELFAGALALARETGDRLAEAGATGNLGNVSLYEGRLEEARGHYERTLLLFREIGARRGEGISLGNLGLVLERLGRLEEARSLAERRLALSREIGDRRGEARALAGLGQVAMARGRFEEALDLHGRFLEAAREIGDRSGESSALGSLGRVLLALGRTGEALARHEGMLALSREVGDRRREAIALASVGALRALLGDPEGGLRLLRECLAASRAIGLPLQEWTALASIGELEDASGDPASAAGHLEEAVARFREGGERRGLAGALAELGALRGREGREEEARALLDEAAALARAVEAEGILAVALAERALLPGGDPAGAASAVLAMADRLEVPVAARARFLLWRATGDGAHLAGAKGLARTLVDSAPEGCREAMAARVRLLREIREAGTGG